MWSLSGGGGSRPSGRVFGLSINVPISQDKRAGFQAGSLPKKEEKRLMGLLPARFLRYPQSNDTTDGDEMLGVYPTLLLRHGYFGEWALQPLDAPEPAERAFRWRDRGT